MNEKKLVWKVGLFVLIGLVLAAGMVMRFSKGTGFSGSYQLNLNAKNAGGIIPGASVLMAGVPVGNVKGIILAQDGTRVTMQASIYDRFKIPTNAVFSIATVGLLGDRYISVSPGNIPEGQQLTFLQEGDEVNLQGAFEISQAAESAAGLMDRLSGTVDQLSNAVQRLDQTLLSQQSLSNLTETVANLRTMSVRAIAAVDNVNSFVETNTLPLSHTVSNLHLFSANLNGVTIELRELVATNRVELSSAMKNIDRATARADQILEKVEAGEGLVGRLISDDELAGHASQLVSNFMVFGQNLNARGIWGVFRKPKESR
jgi:phospholipid/cholesterol/gamma-HCH transport system substrate-binding protein